MLGNICHSLIIRVGCHNLIVYGVEVSVGAVNLGS